MNPRLELAFTSIELVHALPGTWSEQACLALLEKLNYADATNVPPEQRREYAVMALQDLKPDDAARVLLELLFDADLTPGQKENLGDAMTQERCWEEFSELEFHKRLFQAQVLLHEAFPETPQPEANHITAVLSSLDKAAASCLQELVTPPAQDIPKELLVRCLAATLPGDAILNRLFDDPIAGTEPFTAAEYLVWQVTTAPLPAEKDRALRYQVAFYSPLRWTKGIAGNTVFECEPFVPESED